MEDILDEHDYKEPDISQYSFRGKLAGKSWQYDQANNRLQLVQRVFFLMSIVVFYPVLMHYINFKDFDFLFFIERLIYSVLYLLCAIFFHRFRLASLIVSILPTAIILYIYLFYIDFFPVRAIALYLSILFFIGMGFYFHFKEKKLKFELFSAIKRMDPDVKRRIEG